MRLRAALGGALKLGHEETLDGYFAPWLLQMHRDICWYLDKVGRLGMAEDMSRVVEGRERLGDWKVGGTLICMLQHDQAPEEKFPFRS